MRFEPTEEQAAVSEVVRSIVADWEPNSFDEVTDSLAAVETTLSEGGWSGIGIPEEFGGSGYGLFETTLVVEELGSALIPSTIRSTTSAKRALLAASIHASDTAAGARCGELLSETAGGSSLSVARTGSVHSTVISDAPGCEFLLLFSDNNAAVADVAQFDLTAAQTLDTTRSYATVTGEAANAAQLEGHAASRGLAEARILLAAELVGVARTALERSVDHACEREAFGKPIGSFQAVGHRLADDARFVDGARVMCHSAAWHADTDADDVDQLARLALLQAQRAVIHATDSAMQVHGAYGFTWESGLHWFQRRARVASSLLGTTAALRAEVASELAATPVGSSA